MKNKIRGLAAILMASLLLLGLGGCASKSDGSPVLDSGQEGVRVVGAQENTAPDGTAFETVYVPDILEFDRPMNYPILFSSSPNGLYVRDMDDELYEFDAEGHFLRALGQVQFRCIAPDGTLWRLDGVENKGDPSDMHIDYTVYRQNDGGETEILSFRTEQGTADLTVTDKQLLIAKQYWDDNNTGHYSLEVYDTGGTLLHRQELSEWFQIRTDGAAVYFTGMDDYTIFAYDGESFALNKVDAVEEDCSLCGIHDGQLYLNDGVCVYRRAIGGTEREALFRYDEMYLSPQLAPIPMGGSESFFFYDLRNQVSPYRLVRPVDKNSLPAERQTLVMAINEAVPEEYFNQYGRYRDAILDFNTVNRQYEIVVKNYADCENPQMALNADIAAGAAPDLVDVSNFQAGMVSSSNCEDLLPYFDRDLGTDCLLQGPLSAMLTGGKLLTLIPSFGIRALLGPASLTEGQTVSGFSDLAALAGGAERVFAGSVNRSELMLWAFANNRRDYSAGQVADVLSFAALLPEGRETAGEKGVPELGSHEKIRSGEQRFELASINDFVWSNGGNTWSTGLAGEEVFFGEKLSFLGLPDGGQGKLFLEPTGELMIPLNAQNKEGAWEFMKFLLSDRYWVFETKNNAILRDGIPITVSALEPVLDAMKNAGSVLRFDDLSYEYDPAYYEELFHSLIDSVDGVCRGGDELYSTVCGLAESYFAGDKTLEQVSQDIASRLKVYNAEQG